MHTRMTLLQCWWCGAWRQSTELAMVYFNGHCYQFCHGALDPAPSCYEKAQASGFMGTRM